MCESCHFQPLEGYDGIHLDLVTMTFSLETYLDELLLVPMEGDFEDLIDPTIHIPMTR